MPWIVVKQKILTINNFKILSNLFSKENDSKSIRAIKKAEEEREIQESKQKQLQMLNEEVKIATITIDKLLKYRMFPKFIEDVLI